MIVVKKVRFLGTKMGKEEWICWRFDSGGKSPLWRDNAGKGS
jgi:hypothetical protein